MDKGEFNKLPDGMSPTGKIGTPGPIHCFDEKMTKPAGAGGSVSYPDEPKHAGIPTAKPFSPAG